MVREFGERIDAPGTSAPEPDVTDAPEKTDTDAAAGTALVRALRRAGIRPAQLWIEVTERGFANDAACRETPSSAAAAVIDMPVFSKAVTSRPSRDLRPTISPSTDRIASARPAAAPSGPRTCTGTAAPFAASTASRAASKARPRSPSRTASADSEAMTRAVWVNRPASATA